MEKFFIAYTFGDIALGFFFFKRLQVLEGGNFLGGLRWVFVATWAFFSCGERGLLFVAVHGLLLLQSTGSRHVGFSSCGSQALERRLSSCGAQA